ncbi:MAG: hypothetical protein ACE5Z5_09680 [Candidatus Bathyarchaeia archaeon]
MYGWDDLKKITRPTEDEVPCPVRGCDQWVNRQRGRFRRNDAFLCMKHGIYISPSTFEYERLIDNLLTREDRDLSLLSDVLKVKTESRMRRDNSEDAVVWNVFRTLEKKENLSGLLYHLELASVEDIHLKYWSHFKDGKTWEELTLAREEFKERSKFRTEPDLILHSPKSKRLSFLEAKLGSNVKQKFKHTGPELSRRREKYGDHDLFEEVFKKSYTFESVAIEGRHYELLRQWLLGNWLAKKLGAEFLHLLLARDSQKKDGESFGKFIVQDSLRTFRVLTWNDLHGFFSSELEEPELANYLEQKTLGYKKKGSEYHLQRLLNS